MWSVDERMRVRSRHRKSEALGQLAGPQVMVGALGVLDLSALKSEPAARRQVNSWASLPGHMGENNFSLASCMMHESVVKVDVGLVTSVCFFPRALIHLRTTGHDYNLASEIIDGIIGGTIRQVRN